MKNLIVLFLSFLSISSFARDEALKVQVVCAEQSPKEFANYISQELKTTVKVISTSKLSTQISWAASNQMITTDTVTTIEIPIQGFSNFAKKDVASNILTAWQVLEYLQMSELGACDFLASTRLNVIRIKN